MNPFLMRIAALSNGKALAIGAFITLFYWQMIYDDGQKYVTQYVTVSKELDVEREKEKETDRALARKDQLQESYNALSEQFRLVSAQIPVDLDAPEVIRTVDTMAKTSGITIKAKEPKAPQREDILEIYPIRVQAEGSFSEMTMFFYNLSTYERIYRVRSFSFSMPADDKKAKKLTLDAELASFKFIPESEADKEPVQKGARPKRRNKK